MPSDIPSTPMPSGSLRLPTTPRTAAGIVATAATISTMPSRAAPAPRCTAPSIPVADVACLLLGGLRRGPVELLQQEVADFLVRQPRHQLARGLGGQRLGQLRGGGRGVLRQGDAALQRDENDARNDERRETAPGGGEGSHAIA